MSLRVRLAVVLAVIMIGPLVAAGIVVGVLVPRATARAADADLHRTLTAASAVLGQRCRELGDLARAAATELSAAGPAARSDAATISAVLGPLLVGRGEATMVALTGDRVVAGAGPQAGTWNPAWAAGASCSQGSTGSQPGTGAPELVESAQLPVLVGVPASRVVAVSPVDQAALVALRDGLGATGVELALVPGGSTTPVASTLPAAAGGTAPTGIRPALVQAAGGAAAGEAGGWQFEQLPSSPGVPYRLVALRRSEGSGLQRTLLVVLVIATVALLAALMLITSRLTRPLVELTAVARRLGGGDLSARSGIRGTDEVGTLAAALDAMADELESTVQELRSSQSALSHTFACFGEALGATHDLDGLLTTVVAAAMRGSESAIGVVYLGDAKGLDPGVTSVPPNAPATVEDALAGLADLADDAVRRGELVVTDLVDAAGPALAVPLRREGRVIGALGVAREAGTAPFDPLALEAVSALAAHAGTAVANVRTHEETSRQSITDPLTGAGNFRHLTATMGREVERASRFNRPLSLLMLDLDHFKQVNDSAGHAFGDAVLREFARRLSGCLREVDVVARYGGEEFVVVLPETAADGAAAVAARIVEAVRKEPFAAGGKTRTVTVSVGVAAFPDHGATSAELMRSADAALYAAKHEGRDRWVLAGGSTSQGVQVAQTG